MLSISDSSFLQVSTSKFCNTSGLTCIEKFAASNFSCMPGCTGIYADIQINVTDLTKTTRVLDLLRKYKNYKDTLTKNIQFDGTRRGEQRFR